MDDGASAFVGSRQRRHEAGAAVSPDAVPLLPLSTTDARRSVDADRPNERDAKDSLVGRETVGSAAPAQPPAPKPRSKMEHLDGMRGLAALWVFFIHYLPSAWPELHEELLGYQKWNASVPVFFILSGRVVTASVLRSRNFKQLVSCMIRRPFRLMVPMFIVAMLDWHWDNVKDVQGVWDSLKGIMWFLFDDGPIPRISGVVWTLSNEYIFSNLLYVFTLVLIVLGDNHKARYLVLIGGFFWFQVTHSWMTHFIAGLFLADLAQHGFIKRYQSWRFSPIVTATIFFGSMVLSFRTGNHGVDGPYWKENFVIFLFSFATMFALETSTWMQYVFSLPPFKFLGHVSFTLYLLHPYLLDYFAYNTTKMAEAGWSGDQLLRLSVAVNTLLMLLASWLLTPIVDHPGIYVGRWVERVIVMEPWEMRRVVSWCRKTPRRVVGWARRKCFGVFKTARYLTVWRPVARGETETA
nr:hypothetical protein HK105_004562 [Polyrhizophydium stewartii]